MDTLNLEAQVREDKGKGFVKKLRREGFLPGVLYGLDVETLPVTVNVRDLSRILRSAGENALIRLEVNGKEHITLVRELQRHPVRGDLIHVDFFQISLKEKLETVVPLRIVGESPGVRNEGGILQQMLREIDVRCLPTEIPEYIEVDISNLGFGENIVVGDLEGFGDIELLADPDTALAAVVAPHEEEEEEVEEIDEEDEGAAEEGEEEEGEGEEEEAE
ncbi:MAG: 50S ribosomal protein L25/general stress protein Ctc, partial [Clostridia bacterium]|nr:50S ribosomal protein L25/general stress protein Ctc [Clostridia bacterium]